MWLSPLFPKLSDTPAAAPTNVSLTTTRFKEDMIVSLMSDGVSGGGEGNRDWGVEGRGRN